jgi:uncharacterized protein (DUF2236 family)
VATPPLRPGDWQRLRYAAGRDDVDPTRSLFDPHGTLWRVNRESVLLLGGGRALLLQVAHPLVAAGVGAHSNFEKEPLQRLRRTLDLTLTAVFADAASALRAVRVIEARHKRVHGVLKSEVGAFAAGTRYDANAQELLFWVHATLVDSALRVYERFVQRLSRGARAAYYEESKITARLFGIDAQHIPDTLAEFERYVNEMIAGPHLAVGETGRRIAASVLRPPLAPGLRQAAAAASFFTAGLLPARVRELYGLDWDARRERRLRRFADLSRLALPVLPGLLRDFPHARRAAATR